MSRFHPVFCGLYFSFHFTSYSKRNVTIAVSHSHSPPLGKRICGWVKGSGGNIRTRISVIFCSLVAGFADFSSLDCLFQVRCELQLPVQHEPHSTSGSSELVQYCWAQQAALGGSRTGWNFVCFTNKARRIHLQLYLMLWKVCFRNKIFITHRASTFQWNLNQNSTAGIRVDLIVVIHQLFPSFCTLV